MIERKTIQGREATLTYLSADFEPVRRKRDAVVIKVVFDDGQVVFLEPLPLE